MVLTGKLSMPAVSRDSILSRRTYVMVAATPSATAMAVRRPPNGWQLRPPCYRFIERWASEPEEKAARDSSEEVLWLRWAIQSTAEAAAAARLRRCTTPMSSAASAFFIVLAAAAAARTGLGE
ncbi:hypothetical protein GQ55_1G177500 [Panicum hallii var. hallii]|uniref:Uncharacterized protein n=1 Tax=Panicum hallii var. hallii TaxID=1504633 RepID=A0A2T7F5Z0_9POAL|nr:hypothetical protein GQ55_1G177500 [Panicum hallii var. hallii]